MCFKLSKVLTQPARCISEYYAYKALCKILKYSLEMAEFSIVRLFLDVKLLNLELRQQ